MAIATPTARYLEAMNIAIASMTATRYKKDAGA